jgi:hypothetical protein
MKKILLSILGVILGLSILIVGSLLIDNYVYSWHILRCDGKAPFIKNSSAYPYGKDLDEKLDLESIAKSLHNNSSFEFPKYNPYTDSIVITKRFEGKSYIISFRNNNIHKPEAITTKYDIGGGMSGDTIPCSTPNYRVLMNTHQMIDDLPLTDAQKQKLKDFTGVGGYRGWSP